MYIHIYIIQVCMQPFPSVTGGHAKCECGHICIYIYLSIPICIFRVNRKPYIVKTRRWECDRPGVEPTSSGLHVWGQYHSSENVSCDKWYWNPSPHISGYMCGARRVVRRLLLTTYIYIYIYLSIPIYIFYLSIFRSIDLSIYHPLFHYRRPCEL